MEIFIAFVIAAVIGFAVSCIAALMFVWAGVGLEFGQALLIAWGISIASFSVSS